MGAKPSGGLFGSFGATPKKAPVPTPVSAPAVVETVPVAPKAKPNVGFFGSFGGGGGASKSALPSVPAKSTSVSAKKAVSIKAGSQTPVKVGRVASSKPAINSAAARLEEQKRKIAEKKEEEAARQARFEAQKAAKAKVVAAEEKRRSDAKKRADAAAAARALKLKKSKR